MSSRDQRHARLLAEALHPDWAASGATVAARAARAARRHRRVRVTAGVAGVCAVVALIASLTLARRAQPAAVHQVATVRHVTTQPAKPRGYEVISDDELLATVTDRTLVAVKRPDGSQRITVLDN